MKKQLLLLVVMLLPLVASAYDFEVNGIFYGYNATNQTAYVTSGNTKYSGDIIIPNTVSYNGRQMSVSEIGWEAFKDCTELASVSMTNSVQIIGNRAFYGCVELTKIDMSGCIQKIGEYAFYDCKKLKGLILPETLEIIEMSAFAGCGVEFLSIPKSVVRIGMYAFSSCCNLKTFVFSDSNDVVTLGNGTLGGGYQGSIFSGSKPHSFYIGRPLNILDNLQYDFADSLSILTIGSYMNNQADYEQLSENIRMLYIDRTNKIEIVYSISDNPMAISDYCFDNSVYLNASLFVPIGSKEKYMSTSGWKNFFNIQEMDVTEMWNGKGDPQGGEGSKEKCEKPTISYQNGKLTFYSATEGATCQYSITDSDIKSGSGDEIQLTVTYNISVNATKTGYDNSDVATATLCWIEYEPKTEGITDGVAQLLSKAVLIQSEGGFLKVEGIDDGTPVSIFTPDGKQAGSAVCRNGAALVGTNIQPGNVAIVRIGEKSVKVVVN